MKLAVLISLTLFGLGVGGTNLYADPVGDQLRLIQKELEGIKETQTEILQGQQKLSQEHAQLKIWINKRR